MAASTTANERLRPLSTKVQLRAITRNYLQLLGLIAR
jgi:hypothetical protein